MLTNVYIYLLSNILMVHRSQNYKWKWQKLHEKLLSLKEHMKFIKDYN